MTSFNETYCIPAIQPHLPIFSIPHPLPSGRISGDQPIFRHRGQIRASAVAAIDKRSDSAAANGEDLRVAAFFFRHSALHLQFPVLHYGPKKKKNTDKIAHGKRDAGKTFGAMT